MLSVLKRWLGQDELASSGNTAPAAGAGLLSGDYRPELIAALRADHQRLLELFTELERASERGDESACRSALDLFTGLLQDHLLTENRHLYGHFSRNPHPKPDLARQVDDMSADMMRIGKMLHRFITTHARTPWGAEHLAQLRKDLSPIGEVLAHRIHEEETVLYPLYAQRSAP